MEHDEGKRPSKLLIGAAVAIGLVLAGGIGAAIAAQVVGNDSAPTTPGVTLSPEPADPTPTPDDATPDPADSPTDDPEAFQYAVTVAIAETGADGATSIETVRDGWEVDVRRGIEEIDVYVASDGTATVVDSDDEDDRDRFIVVDQIPDIFHTAIEAAGGGTVQQISTDDDDDHFYQVDIRLDNGQEVEVELTETLGVHDVDVD